MIKKLEILRLSSEYDNVDDPFERDKLMSDTKNLRKYAVYPNKDLRVDFLGVESVNGMCTIMFENGTEFYLRYKANEIDLAIAYVEALFGDEEETKLTYKPGTTNSIA